jgi:hypothetical protein
VHIFRLYIKENKLCGRKERDEREREREIFSSIEPKNNNKNNETKQQHSIDNKEEEQ